MHTTTYQPQPLASCTSGTVYTSDVVYRQPRPTAYSGSFHHKRSIFAPQCKGSSLRLSPNSFWYRLVDVGTTTRHHCRSKDQVRWPSLCSPPLSVILGYWYALHWHAHRRVEPKVPLQCHSHVPSTATPRLQASLTHPCTSSIFNLTSFSKQRSPSS